MNISICSYSFHRALSDGKQDLFKYITDCVELEVTHLEPWSGHFDDGSGQPGNYPPQDQAYIRRVKEAIKAAGLPIGCIAIDRAHVADEDPEVSKANRQRAYQWLDIAETLGAPQVRIDSGPRTESWSDEAFEQVVTGYEDLIARAGKKGIEVVIENHWGPSKHPENLVKLLKAVDGLGLLFDTNNWGPGRQEEAWEMCAKYATATHVKTFSFDADGNDPSVNLAKAFRLLQEAGYDGIWGIESVPLDGDEYEGARKTIALIRRMVK